MKLRAIRRDHIVGAIAAGLFGMVLIAVSMVWPAALGVIIAFGGAIGAMMVVYEIRLTKRLAQAEFIRDLQTSFSSDANIGALWRKLLLKEEITALDRPLVSSYLTFFETLHLLVKKGALELALTDDLFRNRFFTAIGNKGILETALVKEAGSFTNIHHLIAKWHHYLLVNEIPIHAGYYGYIQALTEAKGYEIVRLGEQDLADFEELQAAVLNSLQDPAWLRPNTNDMLKECLVNHITLGARCSGKLVAAAVLFDGGDSDESIKHYFTKDTAELAQSINLKLVFAIGEHRKQGLSRTLVELLEQHAVALGKTEIMCTIHPGNLPSQSLFKLLGYTLVDSAATSYGKRTVFARTLPATNKRWAR